MSLSSYANIASAGFGFIAAVFWYQAAMVKFPEKLNAVVIEPIAIVNTDELSKAILESANKNKVAAFLSALSMVCVGIGMLLDATCT
jgi:hypothetical protein